MADNILVTPGVGATIAADEIAGALHQRVKLSQGADGSATDVSSAAPLNVTLANTGANATPVVVDLGANNDVSLNAGTNYVGKVRLTDGTTDGEVVPLAGYNAQAVAVVDGSGAQITSFGGGTQYTEGDTDASITGTATMMEVAANTLQPIQGTVADGLLVNLGTNNDVTVTGTVTSTAQPGVDIGDVTINNAAGASAVNIQDGGNTITVDGTVTINAIPAGTNNIGDVDVLTLPAIPAGTNNIGDVDVLTINGVAPAFGTGVRGATVQRVTIATDDSVPVTIASVPSHAVTNAGTFAVQESGGALTALQIMDDWDNGASDGASVSGDVAHGTADAGEPVKIGGKALSADPTAEATGDRVNALFDLIGRQVTFPYSLKENLVSGAITTAMTGTTSTSLIGAPGAGLYNYITQITVSNAHGTVGTDVAIQDGSGGTTIYTIPAAAVYGGAVVTFPAPLKQPTSNTALYCANVTTGASTKVSASGFKGS